MALRTREERFGSEREATIAELAVAIVSVLVRAESRTFDDWRIFFNSIALAARS